MYIFSYLSRMKKSASRPIFLRFYGLFGAWDAPFLSSFRPALFTSFRGVAEESHSKIRHVERRRSRSRPERGFYCLSKLGTSRRRSKHRRSLLKFLFIKAVATLRQAQGDVIGNEISRRYAPRNDVRRFLVATLLEMT